MCDCLKKVSDSLEERAKEQLGEKGYKFIKGEFVNEALMMPQKGKVRSTLSFPFEVQFWKPKSDGSLPKRQSKLTLNMTPSFCPFCGENQHPDEPVKKPSDGN